MQKKFPEKTKEFRSSIFKERVGFKIADGFAFTNSKGDIMKLNLILGTLALSASLVTIANAGISQNGSQDQGQNNQNQSY